MSDFIFFRIFKYLIFFFLTMMSMGLKVRVGARGQVVIPKRLRERLDIHHGVVLELEETEEGFLLKPYDPVKKLRGLGRGLFGDPVKYQRRLREEWG